MKDSKDLKRNFQTLVVEMKEAEYLAPLPVAERYLKQGVGLWRVRLELHASRVRASSSQQDAHNVLMLWREGYCHEDCAEPDVTTVFIRKNRQGPVGAAELHFNSQLMTFTPVERRRLGERSA
ncbi:MAG: hypothetical protein IT425_10440 [Pirellulales bacterium]|nr:hypothetical protein [Pirellulales bacterium]